MRQAAERGKKWCYDCIHYRTSYFCGYESSCCEKFGSLDMDQHERHPDTTADTCPNYFQKSGARWFDKQNDTNHTTTSAIDYHQYEATQGVAKDVADIKEGDYFKYDDAIWQVIKVTALKSVKAIIMYDFKPDKRASWESRTQCIAPDKCLFIDI